MTLALIDVDTLVYQIAYAAEPAEVDWGDGGVSLLGGDLETSKRLLDQAIGNICADLMGAEPIICLTDSENFRKAIYPRYKAHRTAPKPTQMGALREHLHATYRAFQRPGLEADDVCGILATSGDRFLKGEKIIVSIDKDLQTVPGRLFNPDKPERGVREISLAEADYWFYWQTLCGDTADGFPGCPGVGPKRAEAILGGPGKASWAKVLKAFTDRKLTMEDALTQARLARILRAEDYDFITKKPVLWTPPDYHTTKVTS